MAVAHGGEALKITSDLNGGQLSKSGLLNCVSDCDEALQLAQRNLNRSADLVKVSSGLLSTSHRSSCDLRRRLSSFRIAWRVSPFAKRSRIEIDLSHDEGPKLLIDAGALVVTDLIQNGPYMHSVKL